jgi:class 3 adenylate cyclase/tRNA A-37 threonylcarbamoyl transferase component Bud32/tetratricopeptide (TPR) repeat protein
VQTDDPHIGAELAGYRVESRIGRGGMGVVYRAVDIRLSRPVALKVLAPELAADERFRERFLLESRHAASLDHPHVVPIYEAGAAGAALFIAMRFVEGTGLGELVKREGPLEPRRAISIVSQVASALDAAHRQDLVHRDVKPANVLLTGDDHVYLCDFGLSTLASSTRMTQSGQFLGSVDYVAPEQIEGSRTGPPADLYSLGCVLVECLSGETAYPRDSDLAVLWAHLKDEPPSVSARRPGLPTALDDVVMRALAKNPEERFPSCDDLAQAALAALDGRLSIMVGSPESRRFVSVLSASVAVSSAPQGGRIDPETIRRLTERCVDEMTAAVLGRGGECERAAGGSIVAVFGIQATTEDDARKAIEAATELRGSIEGIAASAGPEIAVAARVGVEAGEVVTAGRAVSDVAGAPLQVATTLERSAAPGEILLGHDAAALLREAIIVEKHDALDAAHRLVELQPSFDPVQEHALVGRQSELAALRAAYDLALDERRCVLVSLVGAAGIGKSRLALEFARSLGGAATVLRGRCLSYGEGITYWPISEIVLAAAGGDKAADVARLLEGVDDGELIARRVAGAIGLAEAGGGREETFWAVRRFFEHLAGQRPLVLVVEDLHWAEPTLLELLDHLVTWTREAPVLLLCLARPEFLDAHPSSIGSAASGVEIALEALSDSEAALLVERHPSGAGVPPGVVGGIVRAAEGNPLFVEQLLAMAAEEAPGTLRTTLPPAIHALLAARLDRLAPEERLVIECASVEGLVFHVGPLAELCPELGPVALGRHLLALTRKRLVQPSRASIPGEEALRFEHGLIREAAYESLTQARRALLHERFANVLERVGAEQSSAETEIVGYHLEEAIRLRTTLGADPASLASLSERSSAFLATAGRGALARGDFVAGAALLQRASDLLPTPDPGRALIEIDLSTALLEAGRLADAEATAAEVEARSAAEPGLQAHAAVERLIVRYSLDLATAVSELERRGSDLQAALEQHGDDRGLYRFWHLRGLVHWAQGLHARAQEAWERSALHADRAGDRVAYVDLLCWLASAAFFGPTPVSEGVERCEEILEQVRDQPYGRARVLHPLAGLHAMAGRFGIANALLEDANAILGELGLTMQFAVSHPEALVAILQGDLDRAEDRLRLGYERLESMGERGVLATTAALLARVALERGRPGDALEYAEQAETLGAQEDAWTQTTWRCVKARVLAERSEPAHAEQLVREAIAIAERTDDLSSRGDALADLADVLRRSGNAPAALEASQQAAACYERKGDEVSVARTRERMDSMDGG